MNSHCSQDDNIVLLMSENRQIRDKLLEIRFPNVYLSCRVHMFGPSRAVTVEIITVAAAISHQTADPILTDRYNFELRD